MSDHQTADVALEIIKSTRKDFSRTVDLDGRKLVLWPAPAADVALLMMKEPVVAELFDDAGGALGDVDFLQKIYGDDVLRRLFAALIGLCVRNRSQAFRDAVLEINSDDFLTLATTALEVSAPRGVADFFERVMGMATVMTGSTSPKAASTPATS